MKPAAPPWLTVVVPVRDEAPNLRPLYRELDRSLAPRGAEVEFVFVDDGSRDASLAVLEDLARQEIGRAHV